MSLSLTLSFDETFYTEVDPTSGGPSQSATNPDVPSVWDVAVGGHGYILDNPATNSEFHHESIPTLRPVFIEGDSLGEKDINPESLWRFSDRDWSHGAGQRMADLPDSDTSMFWQSKGIDVWTQWQIDLLPDTDLIFASVNSNLHMVTAGDYLYIGGAGGSHWTTDMITFTSITGLPGGDITAIVTDGYTIYYAITGHGIYTTTRGSTTATQLVTGTPTLDTLGYVNGRLMASEGPSLYNVTGAGALPTALFTHPNPDFTWVGFAEGQQALYAGGASADHSEVYRVGISSDGTELTVPILAAPDLVRGETLLAVGGYEGFVVLGTDVGVRLCEADSTGNLTVGALLQTGACRCFTGFDRFIYFGWDLYDTESTGLGRLDLSVEAANGAPAFASDLMVPAQASVVDVATFGGKTVLAVAGAGFYSQSPNLVEQGFLDSGLVTYDIPDSKIAQYLTLRCTNPSMEGTAQAWLSVDQGQFQFIGQHTADTLEDVLTIPELEGYTFEIREVLVRDITFPTLGPVITRHMLQTLPAVNSGFFFYVPVQLTETVQTFDGNERPVDVNAERAYLYGLRSSAQRVIYQELSSSWPVTVDDLTWTAQNATSDRTGFNGTLVLKLKTL